MAASSSSLAERADRILAGLVGRKKEGKPLKRNTSVGEITIEIVDNNEEQEQVPQVRLRRARRVRGEPGQHLKLLLDAFLSEPNSEPSSSNNAQLDAMLKELFNQLDFDNDNLINRSDYEALCSILGIDNNTKEIINNWRKSGLQWLSLYRPNRRMESPIRSDQLANVKYRQREKRENNRKNAFKDKDFTKDFAKDDKKDDKKDSFKEANNNEGSKEGSSPFLYTLGARPFWELWPQRRFEQRHLSLNDFKRNLVETYANYRSKRLSLSAILPIMDKNLDEMDEKSSFSESESSGNDEEAECQILRQLTRRLLRQNRKRAPNEGENRRNLRKLKSRLHNLQNSLRLSEAQNLGLHVLLHKLGSTSDDSSHFEPNSLRRSKWRVMEESERQLEHLIRELRAMSRTEYPDVMETHENELKKERSDNKEYKEMSKRMSNGLMSASQLLLDANNELECTKKRLEPQSAMALERSQRKLDLMRSELEEALGRLEATQNELSATQEELMLAQSKLVSADMQIEEAHNRLRAKRSLRPPGLLAELQATRQLLVETLDKLQDLESKSATNAAITSESVPGAKVNEAIHIDADTEPRLELDGAKPHTRLIEVCVDESGARKPPWPSSSTSTTTSRALRPQTPASSSGLGSTPGVSPKEKNNDELVLRLKNQIVQLGNNVRASQDPNERSAKMMQELLSVEEPLGSEWLGSDASLRLTLLQEKIKEILVMLKSLNDMNISSATLGLLVLESLRRCSDGEEVRVFAFLSHLYASTREFERRATERELQKALDSIEQNSRQLMNLARNRESSRNPFDTENKKTDDNNEMKENEDKNEEEKEERLTDLPYIDTEL